jgi:hypothetical protein
VAQLFILLGTYKKYSVPPEILVISDDALGSVIGQLIFLPMMIVLAHSIPTGFETVMYSAFTSFENILSALSSVISAVMTNALGIKRDDEGAINFSNLWIMLIITSSLGLIPLLFIKFVPKKISSYDSIHVIGTDEEDDDDDSGVELTSRVQFSVQEIAGVADNGDVI